MNEPSQMERSQTPRHALSSRGKHNQVVLVANVTNREFLESRGRRLAEK
jgi:hypothetical protein